MKVTIGTMTENVVATEIMTENVNTTEIVAGTMTMTGTMTGTGIVIGIVTETVIAIVTQLLHGTETVDWAGKPVVVKKNSGSGEDRHTSAGLFLIFSNNLYNMGRKI